MKMVKETKFLRKQAAKAERMALATSDEEVSQSLSNLAQAYRSQADALKKNKNLKKSKKMSGKKREAEGKTEMTANGLPSIFIIEIGDTPTLTFEAQNLSEAHELCHEQWL